MESGSAYNLEIPAASPQNLSLEIFGGFHNEKVSIKVFGLDQIQAELQHPVRVQMSDAKYGGEDSMTLPRCTESAMQEIEFNDKRHYLSLQ